MPVHRNYCCCIAGDSGGFGTCCFENALGAVDCVCPATDEECASWAGENQYRWTALTDTNDECACNTPADIGCCNIGRGASESNLTPYRMGICVWTGTHEVYFEGTASGAIQTWSGGGTRCPTIPCGDAPFCTNNCGMNRFCQYANCNYSELSCGARLGKASEVQDYCDTQNAAQQSNCDCDGLPNNCGCEGCIRTCTATSRTYSGNDTWTFAYASTWHLFSPAIASCEGYRNTFGCGASEGTSTYTVDCGDDEFGDCFGLDSYSTTQIYTLTCDLTSIDIDCDACGSGTGIGEPSALSIQMRVYAERRVGSAFSLYANRCTEGSGPDGLCSGADTWCDSPSWNNIPPSNPCGASQPAPCRELPGSNSLGYGCEADAEYCAIDHGIPFESCYYIWNPTCQQYGGGRYAMQGCCPGD